MAQTMFDQVQAAANAVAAKLPKGFAPRIALVLGSGLGDYASRIENPVTISYGDIPGFPVSTVAGHSGEFVFGTLFGVPVGVMRGRFHFYEGYTMAQSVMGVRLFKLLGAQTLVLTNAAGGVNTAFKPGDLMLIEDHINYSGQNPLIGHNDERFGPRFPDMSDCYGKALRPLAQDAAKEAGIDLKHGVYMMFTGPSYETPAEIRMARTVGADAVGMSTAPEAIAARHAGLKTLGISLITNMAAGVLDQPLSHEEVMETSREAALRFTALVDGIVKRLG